MFLSYEIKFEYEVNKFKKLLNYISQIYKSNIPNILMYMELERYNLKKNY